jgi:hypothetical protein
MSVVDIVKAERVAQFLGKATIVLVHRIASFDKWHFHGQVLQPSTHIWPDVPEKAKQAKVVEAF